MKVCVIGGAGYVGSKLVPLLLKKNQEVTVLDTFWYGDHLQEHHKLHKIKGDIRNKLDVKRAIEGQDAVIHLACISNDPSFELNPTLGKEINYDSFKHVLQYLKEFETPKFIYASSSSVYGVSDEPRVTEDTKCNPLTDYSKYKLMCELELQTYGIGPGEWTILRPATVCGYSPRLRLDVAVNAMTISALVHNKIIVHGGDQTRPNININDMAMAYLRVLTQKADQKIYNVGFQNKSLLDIATTIKRTLQREVEIVVEKSSDPRSYRVDSEKIKVEQGFYPEHTIESAIAGLETARALNLIRDPYGDAKYSNIMRLKELIDARQI